MIDLAFGPEQRALVLLLLADAAVLRTFQSLIWSLGRGRGRGLALPAQHSVAQIIAERSEQQKRSRSGLIKVKKISFPPSPAQPSVT